MIRRTRGVLCCAVFAAAISMALSWAAVADEATSSAMTETVRCRLSPAQLGGKKCIMKLPLPTSYPVKYQDS